MDTELLQKYIEGNATESERLEVAAWIRSDEEHLKEYKALRRLYDLTLWNDPVEVKSNNIHKPLIIRFGSILRYAAIILCVVGVGILWKNYSSRPEKPILSEEVVAAISQAEQSGKNQAICTINGKPVIVDNDDALAQAGHSSSKNNEEAVLTTHHDKEFWLTLSDGTRVHLNYGTSLVYPLHFDGDTREVELTGEAYFYVSKDAKHPFIVHTPTGDVKVYGTEFNVNTCDEAGATRVVLVNGSVGITPKGGEEQMMQPNDMAVMQPNMTEVLMTQVDTYPYVAWNTGSFVFEDCPMETLMKVLSQWYGKQVTYGSSDIRKIEFTGELDKYQPLEQTLKGINSITGLRIVLKNNNIHIEHR